jgi:NADPH:quinone reductase-like Zn-dependent oxidoreductase
MAKIFDGKVIAVVGSTHKVESVKALGADFVIDKSMENLWERVRQIAPDGVDYCYDANGVETLGNSYRHLAMGGKLVIYGFHTMLPKTGV